ncbi:MAG TPA: HAD hydrolase-like protein [Pseudomonadales bacterium]|nr:HAD hydrolase-like protein [Pseudomonadales bacterium]
MTAPNALVFDLDGTISDPSLGIGRSINYALEAFGHPLLPDEGVSDVIGPPIDVTFARLTGSSDGTYIAALVAKFRERYGRVGYSENTLYSGVAGALATIADSGVPLAVCTSKRVDFAERILEMFEVRRYFGHVDGGDVGVPKRDQLARLLRESRIGAGSIMIGDRAFDIDAARVNGLDSVGVLWGHGSRDELQSAGAGRLLERPDQLLELVDRGAQR